MRARPLFAVVLLLACLGAKTRDDGYSLIWKPKQDQSLTYELNTEMTADGHKVAFVTDINLKVTKVAENGDYTVETTRKNLRVIAEGQEHKVPDEETVKPEIETYNKKGDKIGGDEPDDGETDEMSALLGSVGDFKSPEKPVAKGDIWTEEIKADDKKKIKAAKVTYEVVGADKIGIYDVVTVSIKYKQTEGSKPASYEGTISFDVNDMSLVQIDARLLDVPFDEDTKGDMKLKMTRS